MILIMWLHASSLPHSRYRLRPRMLRDVSTVDMRTRILGQEVAFPVCVGATAMQRMAHVDGELATARGKEEMTQIGCGNLVRTQVIY